MRIQKGKIVKVDLAPSLEKEGFFITFLEERSEAVIAWLKAYAQKKQPTAPLSFAQASTPFYSEVMQTLQKIPLGSVTTYQKIAKLVGSPRAFRAVGNACRVNPFPLFIPCHRVLASDGSLGGFAYGLGLKEKILDFEQAKADHR